jgi:hypothetical protein
MFTTSVDVASLAEKINVNVATVVRTAATQLYGKLIERSPVDTGYFRRNWQVSIDTPAEGTVGDKPAKGGTIPAPPPLDIPKGALHVWICNNVVYAEALENGHSKQAPNGMVAISVAEVEAGMEAVEVVI